ncbi:hypothetical protein [Frankia sp. CiP1_Cm_nod1]|uniref:hypothetical protein n=1 Tax=Frankia sp. CiP1_Cm_nod1 TaxID=2897160 RepID=UPI0020240E51
MQTAGTARAKIRQNPQATATTEKTPGIRDKAAGTFRGQVEHHLGLPRPSRRPWPAKTVASEDRGQQRQSHSRRRLAGPGATGGAVAGEIVLPPVHWAARHRRRAGLRPQPAMVT